MAIDEDTYLEGGGCLTVTVVAICILALVGLVTSGCSTPGIKGEFDAHVEVNQDEEENDR